jgi:hypothetical protein
LSGRPVHERDVVASLAALAMVVAAALVGLVSDANWPKLLRVALAFTAYSASCLFLFDVGRKRL